MKKLILLVLFVIGCEENASAMEDGAKFLSYPIPKAIVEEWEKVK